MTSDVLSIIALVAIALFFWVGENVYPLRTGVSRWSAPWTDLAAVGLIFLAELINRPIVGVFFGQLHEFLRLDSVGLISFSARLNELPFALKLVISFLIVDFFLYWLHRAEHRVRFLWRFHRWHHSPTSLFWVNGLRSSLVESFLYALPQTIPGALIFRFSHSEFVILFSIAFFFQIWTHTNLRTPAWMRLHYVFVTPEFHHPHHSKSFHQTTNFGAMLSIWDHAFGTSSGVTDRAEVKKLEYGIGEKVPFWRLLLGL